MGRRVDPSLLAPVPPGVLALALLVTAVSAALQGTVGFGFAVLSVPVLSLVDPRLAPVPQLLVTLPLTLSMAWSERHAVDLKGVGWVLAGRLPGAAIGVLLLELADDRLLDALLASMVLLAIVMLMCGVPLRRRPGTEFGAGVVSGVMGLVSSIGGPPLALLYRNEKGATIRASLAAIFTIGLGITIVSRVLAREITWLDLHLSILLLPALFFGLWVSRYLHGHIEGRGLRVAIVVVAALASLGLIVRAVSGWQT